MFTLLLLHIHSGRVHNLNEQTTKQKKILSHTWIDLFHFDTSLLSLYFNSVRYFGGMILSSLHFTSQFEVFFCNFRSFFANRWWGGLFHLFSTDSSNPIHTKNTRSTFYLMINGLWLLSQISIRNTRIKTHFPSILWNFIIYQIQFNANTKQKLILNWSMEWVSCESFFQCIMVHIIEQ